MISRFTCVALLALALSTYALPSPQQEQDPQCSEITVSQTATVAAQPSLQTFNAGGFKRSPSPNVERRQENQTTSSQNPQATPAATGNGGAERNGGKTGGNNGGKENNNGGQKSIGNNDAGGDKNNTGGNNNGGVNNDGGINNGTGGNNNGGKDNGGKNNGGNNNNPQTSLTLDPRVIGKGFANDGQDVPAAGQVRSLTTTNNFINFCLTVANPTITDGKQVTGGSCNPIPIGSIPSSDLMPSSKFVFPTNFATIKAGQTFTIEMNIKNMETGFFVNAQSNYFAAPQQLNNGGQIKGHSHVVVEQLESLTQTQPTNPKTFAFFKGLNGAAQNGKLTASVDKGLQPGVYRLSSINTSSNHQPVIVPIAQHGSLDDAVYFTVTADGKPAPAKAGK